MMKTLNFFYRSTRERFNFVPIIVFWMNSKLKPTNLLVPKICSHWPFVLGLIRGRVFIGQKLELWDSCSGWLEARARGLLVRNWGYRPGVTRAEEGFRAGGGIFLSFRHNLLVLRAVVKREKNCLPPPRIY